MAIKALQTSGIQYTDRRDFYPDPQEFASLYPSVTPFLSDLMFDMDVRGAQTPDITFKIFEERPGWRQQYFDINNGSGEAWAVDGTPGDTNAAVVDGATGIGANNNTIDSSLLNAEVEIWSSDGLTYRGNARVTTVTSSTAVTLTSIHNPTSATQAIANLEDNDRCFIVTGGFSGQSTSPDGATDELSIAYNSCGIDRLSFTLEYQVIESALRGTSNEMGRVQTNKGNEHKVRMNNAVLRGTRTGGIGGTAHGAGGGSDSFTDTHTNDASGNVVRSTNGFFSIMRRYGRSSDTHDQQNVFVRSLAAYTWDQLVDDLDKANQYNPTGEMKRFYAGPGLYNWFQKHSAEGLLSSAGTKMNVDLRDAGATQVGIRVSVLTAGGNSIELVKDESLRHTNYSKFGYMVDRNHAELVWFPVAKGQSGPTGYFPDIKRENNPLYRKDEFLSCMGLKLGLAEAHSLWQFA